jgi:lincosamide and streptogramin A transport system ATP-binding/permease protein
VFPIAIIHFRSLSFQYEGSTQPLFSNLNLELDSAWRLGFIARNGRGKTTLLRLLSGALPYQGKIVSPLGFAYFPYAVKDETLPALEVAREAIAPFRALEATMASAQNDPARLNEYAEALESYTRADGFAIDAMIKAEAGKLDLAQQILERPFSSLSHGERTKLLLAALFLRHDSLLLIDEPTNHLDLEGRAALARYLRGKNGFILVSHDRSLLDSTIDHVLSINRDGSFSIEQGNYSSWQRNKDLQDAFELAQNEGLKKQISALNESAREKAGWSEKIERGKIGSHTADRGYVGHKAAKMMKRSKAIERRIERAADEKSRLLQRVEEGGDLKLSPLAHPARRLILAQDLSIDYGSGPLFAPLSFELMQGESLCLKGRNGSGKSSLVKLILGEKIPHAGTLTLASGLALSIAQQDASGLSGPLPRFVQEQGIDQSLFFTILRKLGFERAQFETSLSGFSQGQKKKCLLAASLCKPAHLYIWDEPLNYVDLPSRLQIERLLLDFRPTLLFIEHDAVFAGQIATKTILLG